MALGSRPVAQAVKLIGDGLYYSATFVSPDAQQNQMADGEMEALLQQVDALVGRADPCPRFGHSWLHTEG